MESHTGRDDGQALIESIFSVTLITLVISLAVTLVFEMRRLFKHDYVGANAIEAPVATTTPADELARRVMFFDGHSDSKNLRRLTDDGWSVEQSFKAGERLYHVLVKDGQRLVYSNSMGVKLCSDNCSSD